MMTWIIALYLFIGFVVAHRQAPAFARYAWVDYKMLLISMVGWPVILFHDWWINRNVCRQSERRKEEKK